MMSSAIASGSENSFGIKMRTRHDWTANRPGIGRGPDQAITHLSSARVCDEPATAKHRIPVMMSRGGLPVAAPPPKKVDVTGPSAGADGPECCGIKWLGVPLELAT